MEHERLGRLLPDGLDPREVDVLDATWRMLGAVESPAPDSGRMRARIDAVIDALENSHAVAGATTRRPAASRRYVLQGLAAAATLVIGVGIGWFAERSAGSERIKPSAPDATAQIAAMRAEMRDLREMVSLSLMQQQSAPERLKGVTWTARSTEQLRSVGTARHPDARPERKCPARHDRRARALRVT